MIMRTVIFLFLFWSLNEESVSEKFANYPRSTESPPSDPSTVIPPATSESRSNIRVRKYRNGLLLVSNGGEYGTVCDDNFDVRDARVVCRMLNEPSEGARVLSSVRGGWRRKIFLDNVTCSGNETSLNECAHAGWGVHDCDHREDVGVICADGETEEEIESSLSVRLNWNGLLLVSNGGEIGTVCDDDFDVEDARVVCRMLNLTTQYPRVLNNIPGGGRLRIALDDVYCQGNESSLDDCRHNGWMSHNCDHREDVGVRCDSEGTSNFTVRLEPNGLLLVSNGGEYGTVCDDSFDVRDARVVCRMLNESIEGARVLSSVRGGQRRRIVLDDVECSGHEKSLSECRHSRWGDNDCSHHEDVGVRCGPTDELTFDEKTNNLTTMKARLLPNGLLLVTRGGQTGTVCDNDFDINDARVVCRMLNLSTDRPLFVGGFSGGKSYMIALDNVKCLGNETSLDECGNEGWGVHNCDHGEDVAIRCDSLSTDTELLTETTEKY